MTQGKQRGFYSLSQAAELLGIHYETAARWARSGKLPVVRLSRRKTLIPKQRIDALLGGGVENPAAGQGIGGLQQWLPWIGTLTPKEAARLRAFAEDFESVEKED